MKNRNSALTRYFALLGLMALLAASPHLLAQAPTPGPAESRPIPRAQPVNQTQPAATQDKAGEPGQPAVPLRAGDSVDLRIANVPPEDQGQWDAPYTVDESGNLNLPFVGVVKAGGFAPSQVQVIIQNKLIADGIYTNPTVTVNPPAGMRFISIGGEVRAPGRVPYTSDLTLMSAINAAGSFTDFAGDKIRMIRGGKVEFFSRKKLDKDPSKDPRIEPGDQIEVKQSLF